MDLLHRRMLYEETFTVSQVRADVFMLNVLSKRIRSKSKQHLLLPLVSNVLHANKPNTTGRRTFHLKVKVSDVFGVQVEDSIQDLLEKLRGLLLAQRLLFCEEVEELTASHTGGRERRRIKM